MRIFPGLLALRKWRFQSATKKPPPIKVQNLVSLINQRQFEKAVGEASKLTKRFPANAMLWNLLGIANSALENIVAAEVGYRKAIRLSPDFADAYNNLGVSLHQLGKYEAAIEAFYQCVALRPHFDEAHFNLGLVFQDQGQFDDAIAAFNRVLILNPGHAEAHTNMGNALVSLGRYEQAVTAFSKAISINKDFAEAYVNMGNALMSQGEPEGAVSAYAKAITIKPDFGEAHNAMGDVLVRQGRYGEAFEAYEKAASYKSEYVRSLLTLGTVHQNQGKPEDAIKAYRQAISIKPDFAEAYINLGNILRDQGAHDEAIATYRDALKIKPGCAMAYKNLGVTLVDQHELNSAISAFNQVIALQPDNAETHRYLSALKQYADNDPQIEQMEKLLSDSNMDDDCRCHICFALAKAFEDLGNLERAYQYLKEGNALRKNLLGYDIRMDEIRFARIKKFAKKIHTYALAPQSGLSSPVPIFILGMPRSGTSLVEQIVSAHSQVHGGGELNTLNQYGFSIAVGRTKANTDALLKLREQYLGELGKISSEQPFVTDKMPGNFRFIGLICAVFPEAKIVHVKRQPAASCWSNYRQYFSGDGLEYSYDLQDIVSYYGLYTDLMGFWNRLYAADRIYHLDYDKLTVDQERETKKLIKYLALDWEDVCLFPHQNKRIVRTASHQQVKQKVYQGSSEKWRKFEPFLDGAFDQLDPLTAPPSM